MLDQLSDSKSSKRKSAAQALAKTKDVAYGPALLQALQKELKDQRTWQTQCAMIKAIADVGYSEAVDTLWQLAEKPFENSILYIDIGTSLCRLHPISNEDLSPVMTIIASQNVALTCGAFRAILYQKLVPESQAEISQIIECARRDIDHEGQIITKRSYIAAAAYQWSHPDLEDFLIECKESQRNFLRQIADSSLLKKDFKWKPW